MAVAMPRAGDAEIDEMWSVVGNNGNQCWLWQTIDHHTGVVLAFVCGRRTDAVFLRRTALREPFRLARFSTDVRGAYTRHLAPDLHRPGRQNMQNLARQPLTRRARMTRVVRKVICFSTSTPMPAMVIGVLVNRSAFGRTG